MPTFTSPLPSAFALYAVRLAVLLARELGPALDQKTGSAGELVRALRDDVDDELFGDYFTAGSEPFIEGVGFVQLGDDAAGLSPTR
ncbi:hypothetical protein GCM10007170_42200 [Arthrobacter liuii]|uniref:Uncharacterized protein n=1 Tax=Arthrobacter liuii TaxID=1476996 RepID=A0ABQ2AY45_9MICC|nr:hypothetical protein GCM10007170_42200 [Arthrobacter liuii]